MKANFCRCLLLMALLPVPLAGAYAEGRQTAASLPPEGEESAVTNSMMAVAGVDQAKRTLEGTVLDANDGQPLIGASVLVKGTKTGVITDMDGHFTLSVSGRSSTLEVSYVGYKTQEVYVTDQAFVSVQLVPDDEMLGEVVVVGAGTQKKISVTGAITSVEGAVLKAPSSSLTNSIAGKLAGVIHTSAKMLAMRSHQKLTL